MTAFLDLAGFEALWDGPTLTTQQQASVTLLLGVASKWITDRLPSIADNDPTAQLVVFEVVSNLVRYGKYAPLSSYSRMTGHRSEAGTLSVEVARYFTDDHKMLLGIPLRSAPMSQFFEDDFTDPTRPGWGAGLRLQAFDA